MSSGDYESDDLDLLAAARSERPRDDLRARALAAASLAGGVAVTKVVVTKVAATKAGAKVGFGATLAALFAGGRVLVLKPVVAVAVVAGASALVVERTRDEGSTAPPLALVGHARASVSVAEGALGPWVARAHALTSAKPAPEDVPAVEPPRPASSAPASEAFGPSKHGAPVSRAPAAAAPMPAIVPSGGTRPAGPPRSSLSDEMELVDAARAELRRGAVSGALSRLEVHASRFPTGALAVERDALRIEALAARGSETEALVAARAFVLAHPGAPLPPRARRVLERDPKNADAVPNP